MEELMIILITVFGCTAILFILKDEYSYSYNQKRTMRVHKKTNKTEYLINNQWEQKL